MKEKMRYTHEQLEHAGSRWLARVGFWWTCKYVAIEPGTPCKEHPDIIGFEYGVSHVIECKTTRADFLRDFHKPWRASGDKPMGARRWWLCEEGLITRDDLAECGDGLLWIASDGDIQVIKDPSWRSEEDRNMVGEFCILYSMLNKVAEYRKTFF